MRYSGAEIIIKLLEQEGVEIVAGIPGGANLPLYDALYKSKIRHVLARHEQGAGFIAQGMARSTGRAAVCLATSGPGATNLLTAIADAKMDSVPLVAITGQVASNLIGSDAFQEVDMYGLTVPITKHNYLVSSADDLLNIIPEAFQLAQTGRPGPVAIDVPKDIQNQQLDIAEWPAAQPDIKQSYPIGENAVKAAVELIAGCERPVLYIGGGIVHSGASERLIELARKNSIPVATTLMGMGSFPDDDPLYLGMLGMHGSRYTNYIINEADLLIAFGVRFDDRATGNIQTFCPDAAVIHVDIDPAELDKLRTAHVSIRADIGVVLDRILPLVERNSRRGWLNRVEQLKERYPFVMPGRHDHYHPLNIIRYLGMKVGPDTIISTDVGQHQMWVAQSYPFSRPRTLLTSGSLGTMGFGLPAAIGAALANPDKRVLCFSGDGSILMNIQELATLADWQLNIAIIVFNNGHLGLVRQQQELFYQGHYIASRFRTSPNFAALARSFGIRGYDLDPNEDPYAMLNDCLYQAGPCLINVPIDGSTNVFPMVPPGKAIYEMIGGEQHA